MKIRPTGLSQYLIVQNNILEWRTGGIAGEPFITTSRRGIVGFTFAQLFRSTATTTAAAVGSVPQKF